MLKSIKRAFFMLQPGRLIDLLLSLIFCNKYNTSFYSTIREAVMFTFFYLQNEKHDMK